ncbi:MAG: long-chain fatty acid--CoA ligase [Sediminibacterium sp.]|jgi:long-chain acyl-CoA synthetase|nr:long-chain fatty acid--CoA ligase [Sediminibacterium sp.]
MEIKRLFDCIEHQLKHFPQEDMLAAKENGVWRKYSTQEIATTVNQLSAGLLTLGLSGRDYTPEGSDKIAIISSNRPEWLTADLAAQQIGVIWVPVYPTTNPLELKFILNDASVQYMFASNQELYDKVMSIKAEVPCLKEVYTFDHIAGAKHWTSLLNKDADLLNQVEVIKKEIPVEQVATFIYTSGTTGTPKGVMLTHKSIYFNLQSGKKSFPFPDAPDQKVLSFLPLNHIFEKVASYIYMYSGMSIYYAESLETIGDNLKEIKPDGFSTVPRLLEKVFEKIMITGESLTGVKRKLFFWAVALGEQYDNLNQGSWWYRTQLKLANKLIFVKWREALGGNVKFIVTGGAACQVKLLRIFNAAQIPVYEGYGPTENSPIISINLRTPGGTKYGTVGHVISGVDYKLEPDGEICVAGPSVMKGYYKRPDLTAETIINGWLHTGDIGQVIDGKYLKITDRKKELFKTSGGKYVAPQPIENKMKESPFIEQIVLIGDNLRFVSALIVPGFSKLKEWAKQHGIEYTSNEEIIKNSMVVTMISDIVDEYNKLFNQVEQVKKFTLIPREFSIDRQEMTPKLSIRRKNIIANFEKEIEAMYV